MCLTKYLIATTLVLEPSVNAKSVIVDARGCGMHVGISGQLGGDYTSLRANATTGTKGKDYPLIR